MKMEAICSSEMLVDFQRSTQDYIPEDNTLHVYRDFLQIKQKHMLQ
jgi:hypothetical protein